MQKAINWVKENKLLAVVLLVSAYLVWRGVAVPNFPPKGRPTPGYPIQAGRENPKTMEAEMTKADIDLSPVAPTDNGDNPQEDRLWQASANISLVVDNVREKVRKITQFAENSGGYLVSSAINQPEEKPYARLAVRIPANKLEETLALLRELAIKVSNERILGKDITDQYTDITARLANLEKTKAKFEELLEQATQVNQIMQVQREITNTQRQIDALRGRQKYLEKSAKTVKVKVYLATDEWSLPYAPKEQTFRPKLVFKQAVRSLVLTLRQLATKLIWLAVYSPLVAPVAFVAFLLYKRKSKL